MSPVPKGARTAVHGTQSPHSRPPLLSPVGSRVQFKDAMPSPVPPAHPWSQVSVAPRTQTLLRNALPSESGPCAPLRCPTAGTSVASLVPLVRSLGAWLALPRPSRWLMRTIRLGYAIQFARRSPKFRGVRFTSVLSKDAPLLRAEVAVLLAKDAIEPVPPAEMKSGFYSPYFIVPKKGGGLRTNLGPARSEPGPSQAPVQDVDAETHLSMHPSVRLVRSGRPEGRVLSCLDPPSTQTISLLCVRRASISVQGPPLRAPQPVGASGQLGKEQTLPWADNLFSRYGVGLGQPHSTSLNRTCSVDAELPGVFPAQDGSTETVSEAPGHMASAAACHAPGLLHMRPLQRWLHDRVPEIGMAMRHVTGLSHPVLPVRPSAVVRSCFFFGAGVPLVVKVSMHVVVSTNSSAWGWGAMCNGQQLSGLLDRTATAVACQLPSSC